MDETTKKAMSGVERIMRLHDQTVEMLVGKTPATDKEILLRWAESLGMDYPRDTVSVAAQAIISNVGDRMDGARDYIIEACKKL